jgi:hypothetical protein
MENLLVTCPSTGRLEEIGCIVDRDGEVLVVLRCTRFEPPTAITCSTPCERCVNGGPPTVEFREEG